MRSLALLLAALLAAAVFSESSFGADVRSFEIMGFRLGMTAKEAMDQAKARRFKTSLQSPGPSFDQAVLIKNQQHVPRSELTGVGYVEFENDQEMVSIMFVPTRDGSQAYRIQYGYFGLDLTKAQMLEQVIAEFGPPDKQPLGRRVWGKDMPPFGEGAFLEYHAHRPAGSVRPYVGMLTLTDPALERGSAEAVSAAASNATELAEPKF